MNNEFVEAAVKNTIELHNYKGNNMIELMEGIHLRNFAISCFPDEIIKQVFALTNLKKDNITNLVVDIYSTEITEEMLSDKFTLGSFIMPTKTNKDMRIQIYFSRKVSINMYFECIFHEICHLKQYLSDPNNHAKDYAKEEKERGYFYNKYEIEARKYSKSMIEKHKDKLKELENSISKLKLIPTLTMDELDIRFIKPIDFDKERELIENIYVLVFSEEFQDSDLADISVALDVEQNRLRKFFIANGGKTPEDLELLIELKEYETQCSGLNQPIFFWGKENAQKVADFLNNKFLIKESA